MVGRNLTAYCFNVDYAKYKAEATECKIFVWRFWNWLGFISYQALDKGSKDYGITGRLMLCT